MKIYLIEKKEIVKPFLKDLQKYGKVVVMDSGEKDINKYHKLFTDEEDKVLGVNTGMIEWKLPNEAIGRIKNLKGICSKSTWINYLDLDYCKKNGIKVCNLPGYNAQSVAEYAIWMMFSLARKLPLQESLNYKVIRNADMIGTEILGKTIGIVGLGNIGKRIAKMGIGMGMEVIYWSKNSKDKRYKYERLDNVLKRSDFLFNCLQTLEGTSGILSKEKLKLLKASAYVISVIGGMGFSSEDDDYLVEAVNTGKLAGFAIENEHKPDYKLPKIKKGANVFVPGNYAYYTKEAQEKGIKMWLESLIGIAKGKPVNLVN